MLLTLAVGLVLVQQGSFRTDTTVAVSAGTRLVLNASSGEMTVRTWDRNQVRIRANHASRSAIEIRNDGAVLRIDPRGRMGMPGSIDVELTVPVWLAAEIQGMNIDVEAEGVRGVLKLSTLNGDLTVRNAGDLQLTAINGDIRVDGARGAVRLNAVSGRIVAMGVQGDLTAETVSGNIRLTGIESSRVDAQTVSGTVIYEGTVRDGGAYTLASHSGSIYFALPPSANASIQTASYSGGLSASFTLPQREERSRRRDVMRFGTGSAAVELESFSGNLRLIRPGEVPDANERRAPRPPRTPLPPGDYLDWLDLIDVDLVSGLIRGVDLGLAAGFSGLRHLGRDLSRDLRIELRNELRNELKQDLKRELRWDRRPEFPRRDSLDGTER